MAEREQKIREALTAKWSTGRYNYFLHSEEVLRQVLAELWERYPDLKLSEVRQVQTEIMAKSRPIPFGPRSPD